MSDCKPSMKALLDKKEQLERKIRALGVATELTPIYVGVSSRYDSEYTCRLSARIRKSILDQLKEELTSVEAQLAAACHEFLQDNHKPYPEKDE